MPDPTLAIEASGLLKRYDDLAALDGLDLSVSRGTVHGLLGPNGAGKTTAVRALSTLLRLDGGTALVAGVDVDRDPLGVRRRIGLAGQYAAVDEILTGRQNLVMFARLFHLGNSRARRRADELLEQFDLVEAADKGVKEYSGGMRRRLDLAASMVLAPEVMFLDEPTTGLDPRGRNEVWASVRELVAGGTTVLLTTQYLDEADQLAGRISVIDHGRSIADGTPSSLKAQVGGDQVEVVAVDGEDLPAVVRACAEVASAPPEVLAEQRRVIAPVADRVAALAAVVARLRTDEVPIEDISLRRPTLDDVFLRLTGRRPAEESAKESAQESAYPEKEPAA